MNGKISKEEEEYLGEEGALNSELVRQDGSEFK